MEHMKFETPDLVQGNIEKIEALFPNCVTETRGEDGKLKKAVNFELLRQMLSGDVVEGDEAYEFTWVGKKAAIVEANKPIRKTLRPCPEESVDWDATENLYIEGDNLEVLKLLQESYLGKVKMIYIDPPYNTGNDFIYRDDFAMKSDEYEQQLGMFDEETGERLFKNTDSNGRFHSDWCSMIYSRLLVSRNLLSPDGVIFISIGEEELENLYEICNEVFSKSCHLGTFIWKRRQMVDSRSKTGVSEDHEYLLCYAKNKGQRILGAKADMSKYSNPDNDPRGDWMSADMTGLATAAQRPNLHYRFSNPNTGVEYSCPPLGWRYDKKHMAELIANNEIIWPADQNGRPRRKKFKKDLQSNYTGLSTVLNTVYNTQATRELKDLFDGKDYFDFPKPTELLKLIIEQGCPEDGIVLDFFSGSATTADAVMQLSSRDKKKRQFIMVQVEEPTGDSEAGRDGYKSICEVAIERIRRAGKKIAEENDAMKNLISLESEEDISLFADIAKHGSDAIARAAKMFPHSDCSNPHLDVGFRVLKLDDSNMNDVYYSADEYDQGMLAGLESNIKPDRTDLDLLFGCLLEWGLPLSLPYKSEKLEACTVHTYNDGDLIACFDENVPDSVIKAIARRRPLRAVFRDSSFASSPAKINVEEIFKMLAPDTRVKVI